MKTSLHIIFNKTLIAALLCLTLSACDQVFNPPKEVKSSQNTLSLNSEELLATANIYVYTQMSEALNQAQLLDGIITTFLHHPNPLSLEEAQQAWLKSYQAYLKVGFFHGIPRFEKPQHQQSGDTYANIQLQLDSWPIEAGYIDYLPMYPLSGIINDMTLKISQQSILEQHGFSDQRFASVGFHPMEFLLFGLDANRSAKDFVPQENSIETVNTDTRGESESELGTTTKTENEEYTQPMQEPNALAPQNHNRRREFLRLLSALIVENMQKLTDRWEPAHGYYAKQWRQPQQIKNLQRIYQASMDTLQYELLNQHLHVLVSQEPLEDLRSPFAGQDRDNMRATLQGIESLFSMENGFIAELKSREAQHADEVTAQFKRLLLDVNKLPKNLNNEPLPKRKKIIAPIQLKLIELIGHLYAGAEILGLQLKALPISTN